MMAMINDRHLRSVRSVRSLKRRPRVHSADYHIMRQRSRSLEQVSTTDQDIDDDGVDDST